MYYKNYKTLDNTDKAYDMAVDLVDELLQHRQLDHITQSTLALVRDLVLDNKAMSATLRKLREKSDGD